MTERWLPVVGFEENYSVSSYGRVMRTSKGHGTRAGRILKPYGNRYLQVDLFGAGGWKRASVHRLVAEAFIGDPCGKQVNHKDANKMNNYADNLEYMTAQENMRHAAVAGLMSSGMDHYSTTLTDEDGARIKDRLLNGDTGVELANEYGVDPSTISDIKLRLGRWKWLLGLRAEDGKLFRPDGSEEPVIHFVPKEA